MNKKILCIPFSVVMLTGCISSKVDRLHTTTTTISTEFDKYAKLSDRVADNTQGLYIKKFKGELSDHSPSETMFNNTYMNIYKSKVRSAAIKQQNRYLAQYFKTLPLLLEDKKADIVGLVTGIDMLNQAIEQNTISDGSPKQGLNSPQKEVITKTLSSGFSIYQYHIFKKNIQNHSQIIIEALMNQRILLAENAKLSTKNLNKEFYESYKASRNTYLKGEDSSKPDSAKYEGINKLINQPYKLIKYSDLNDISLELPKTKSKAYIKNCEPNDKEEEGVLIDENEKFIRSNKDNLISYTNKIGGAGI